MTCDIPSVSFSTSAIEIPNGIQLADPHFNISRPIDMLLGAGIFWKLVKSKSVQLKNSKLSLQASQLGWLVSGEVRNKPENSSISCLNTCELGAQVTKFWETEEVSRKMVSEPELFCENHFVENHTRDSDGRFIVKIPFRENFRELGYSREFALRRFLKLEKRLMSDKFLRHEYVKFMSDYEKMNHMNEISESDNEEELTYYIPHHPVVRESSCTTKLRVVFDASMKTTCGLSLNDVQYAGPTIQNELFTIILQFRLFEFVVTADISKMYR